MEAIEALGNIDAIWRMFVFPFIYTGSFLILLWFVLGKNRICQLINIKFKREEYEGQKYKLKNSIYIPISRYEKLICNILINHKIFILVASLTFIYSYGKIIYFIGNIFPITYSYVSSSLIIKSINENTIAELWSYYPNFSFNQLCNKIIDVGQNSDYVKYNMNHYFEFQSFFEFCIIFFLFYCVYNLIKRKWRICIKCMVIIIISSFLLYCTFFLAVDRQCTILQQECYYTLNQIELSNDYIFIKDSTDKYYDKVKEIKKYSGNSWNVIWKYNINFW